MPLIRQISFPQGCGSWTSKQTNMAAYSQNSYCWNCWLKIVMSENFWRKKWAVRLGRLPLWWFYDIEFGHFTQVLRSIKILLCVPHFNIADWLWRYSNDLSAALEKCSATSFETHHPASCMYRDAFRMDKGWDTRNWRILRTRDQYPYRQSAVCCF